MPKLVLSHLKKQYANGVLAVKDFDLKIEDQEFVVLVGPSGCGKTTVLRMIAGLEEISGGDLWIDDLRCNDLEPQHRDLAMVFQNYALYPHMTVYDNIAFSMRIRRMSRREIDERVRSAATLLGIEGLLHRKPGEISGGQRQRVAIGGAIVRRPKAFLMDEPLSNLDAKLRNQTRVELARLHRELKATIVYVTHDQVEAMTLGSRIVVMKDGVIQQIASPVDLYDHPTNMFVAGFIGTPAMNFFDAYASEDGRQHGLVMGDSFLPAPPGLLSLFRGRSVNRVVLGLRPENLHTDKEVPPEGAHWCPALQLVDVVALEMLGASVVLHCQNGERSVALTCHRDVPYRPGDRVSLVFDMDRIHVFDGETGINLLPGEAER